ncbi:hypothetical protein [Pseudomonas cucumis]|uniref:hypothetical protein n=1 Tax=Pseudomonas cucumis TaxID=2954082 RepID=UPI002733A558|nr:hypothetical protein [Pseudomonas cucumis]WLG93417.1 hypothetical protein PSH72_14850 [Pseudomonas cucumis]
MTDHLLPVPHKSWGAVFAMSLAAFVLVASEFMPVSLLTPIAADLHGWQEHCQTLLKREAA